MSIFGNNNTFLESDLNRSELLESYIYDEISKLGQETIQEFVHSQQAQAMVEAGIIGKKTLVKLSKVDDLERRIGMAALQLAKDKSDPLFDKLVKVRVKEKELLDQINNKYMNKATQVAKIGQRDYLKNKIPVGFMRK